MSERHQAAGEHQAAIIAQLIGTRAVTPPEGPNLHKPSDIPGASREVLSPEDKQGLQRRQNSSEGHQTLGHDGGTNDANLPELTPPPPTPSPPVPQYDRGRRRTSPVNTARRGQAGTRAARLATWSRMPGHPGQHR